MIWASICEHGKMVIRNGEPTEDCRNCNKRAFGYQNGYSERKHFNKTLMRGFNNYHEGEKWAKKKNLACIGNEPLEKVFKPKEPTDYKPMLVENLKRIRAGYGPR